MSNEPGERRRRRDLERARELATQQAAAMPGPSSAEPAPPVSRRERRELERASEQATSAGPELAPPGLKQPEPPPAHPARAAAAADSHPSAPTDAQSDARKSFGVPALVPDVVELPRAVPIGPAGTAPPAPPARVPRVPDALSRRAMRNAAVPVEPVRAPVVHPPTTTGTIRFVPPAQVPAAPRLAGSTSTAARGYPPVAPQRANVMPHGVSAVRPTPPAALPPTSAAPGSQAAWSPLTDIPLPRTPRDGVGLGAVDPGVGAPLAPRWGNVPPGSFDAITRPEPEDGERPLGGDKPAAAAAAAAAPAPAPRARRWAYTWLQLLALALVAFVLGFLVWLLYIRGSAQPGAAGAFVPEPSTSSSSAISSPHLGEP